MKNNWLQSSNFIATASPYYQVRQRRRLFPLLMVAAVVLLASCSSSGGQGKQAEVLKAKQTELTKLQEQQEKLSEQIAQLQKEIAAIDPNAVATKRKLVALDTLEISAFEHYIDLQGKIDAQNVAYVAPKGPGGVVKDVYVKQGDQVRKGQLLLKLDDAAPRQSLIAAQQQVAGVQAQLEQAKTVFERQQNLWKENIGTELQVLNAKTSLESLQSQYEAARANMGIAEEQLSNTEVRAAISGVINQMDIKVGEYFTAGNQIQIVNNDDLKVVINVPENYSGKITRGAVMHVNLPDVGGKQLETTVSVVGRLIDPVNRTFYIEGHVPHDAALRPNQVAMVRIKDYQDAKAITIPVNTIQNDEKGKYVMVITGKGDQMAAQKKYVTIGQMYHDRLQVLEGLAPGDVIISEGFQSLYEGQPVMTGQ